MSRRHFEAPSIFAVVAFSSASAGCGESRAGADTMRDATMAAE